MGPGSGDQSVTSSFADDVSVIAQTRLWLERAVIGLTLCPFAKGVHQKGQIRYAVSRATTVPALRDELGAELRLLAASDPDAIATTLFMQPDMLGVFGEFHAFLRVADKQLRALRLSEQFQIASFHPDFQFADSEPEAIENFSNRAPFPTLHLLREESIDQAVSAFPDAASIYGKNIITLRALGHSGWLRVMAGKPPAERGD